MKKIFKKNFYAAGAFFAALVCVSCESDNDFSAEELRENRLKSAVTAFVDKTVIPTYRPLADVSIVLQTACEAMLEAYDDGNKLTLAMVEHAGTEWKKARQYWEWSEAFLYGAAADYNIDPHIDSWPLDKDALQNSVLNNPQLMAVIEANPDYVGANFGYGLLGFHALEYMLFEEGGARPLARFDRPQLVFLVAVANDLCNQCVRLEAAWTGTNNVTVEKRRILEEAELDVSKHYGDYMRHAGQAGSIYVSYTSAAEEIMQGCIEIATEVGGQKIGRPANGESAEDINYIESPYSHNSRIDFIDNIKSIRNAYQGINDGDASVSDYIKSIDPALDADMRKVIDEAIVKIEACPAPFVKTRTDPRWKIAAEYCNKTLVTTLAKVRDALTRE